jgi:hypothetical protein
MFTFDISYYINSNDKTSHLDDLVFDITNDYRSCKWYASDSGPLSTTDQNTKSSRNHGFKINDAGDLQTIIRRIGETQGLFIDFIIWRNNNEEEKDSIEIYRSKNFLTHASSDFVALYLSQLNHLSGMFKGLHSLCIANKPE